MMVYLTISDLPHKGIETGGLNDSIDLQISLCLCLCLCLCTWSLRIDQGETYGIVFKGVNLPCLHAIRVRFTFRLVFKGS